jgi:hypothetical protein
MDNKVLKNLYSHNIIFDEVTPLRQMNESYNHRLVNDIYIYKDNKNKNLTPETEADITLIKTHINSFLHGTRDGALYNQYTK